MSFSRQRSRRRLLVLPMVVAACTPALAEDGSADPANTSPDGEIIYARDVHHSIGAPHFPGQTHTAVTAPTGAIIGAIAVGLAPLSDSETASVTASVPIALQAGGPAELRLLAPEAGGAQTVLAVSGTQSGTASIGGSIDRAMGALTGALGSLSSVTGQRP